MPTMNISLPDSLREFVEHRVTAGQFGSSSEYMRALIRQDQVRTQKIEAMQARVDEGLASGTSERDPEEIAADGAARARARRG